MIYSSDQSELNVFVFRDGKLLYYGESIYR